jgi:hypothetical protein
MRPKCPAPRHTHRYAIPSDRLARHSRWAVAAAADARGAVPAVGDADALHAAAGDRPGPEAAGCPAVARRAPDHSTAGALPRVRRAADRQGRLGRLHSKAGGQPKDRQAANRRGHRALRRSVAVVHWERRPAAARSERIERTTRRPRRMQKRSRVPG